ncbi:Pirin C-terminal cupin domain-containing protein [Saccharicrinis carchari]|uniref:Pirin C-terminal cupin domain-containing protein n=1 Tax=Saccharicrinis carchari TaxID=1168039 RepID=A0A521AZD0_SACCC|nr:pirin-like C-terminal cupin domain-containing protein [Saccharicrinis carchari]SMO40197.1 Pirin C-terminal cupin domain-containing protein [Saccharicrinis carchari]
MHGLQIWVALPKQHEEMDPEFFHVEKEQIPKWTEGDLQFKLVAGEAFAKKSPVPVCSKLYMIEIKSTTKQVVNIGDQLYGESGLYILEGAIESEENIYGPKKLLIARDSKLCEFTMHKNSTIYIFGGYPFPEKRFIDWNFVSTSKERIEEAKQKWETQSFPKIKGDETDFIPYPSRSNK